MIGGMTLVGCTRTARVEKTVEGIVVTRILPDVQQTVSDAVANISASAQACGENRAPIIVDLRQAETLDAETRHYYSGRKLTDSFSSLAILVPIGAFGKMMGNLYLRVAQPGIPARLFNSEAEALQWSACHLISTSTQVGA
jgi:hypothetical protein